MFIEPCCAHRQLPPLFRDATNPDSGIYTAGIVSFHTNGDVTIPIFLDAASSLIADAPFTILVSTPVITHQLLSHLANYYRRGWADGLLLMDAPSSDTTIVIPPLLNPITRHVTDQFPLTSPVLACIGRNRLLVCTGHLPASSPTGVVTHHSAYIGSHQLISKRYLDPVLSRFRINLHGQSISTPNPRIDEIIAGHLFD